MSAPAESVHIPFIVQCRECRLPNYSRRIKEQPKPIIIPKYWSSSFKRLKRYTSLIRQLYKTATFKKKDVHTKSLTKL